MAAPPRLGGISKLVLLSVFAPLLVMRWFLHKLPGKHRRRRASGLRPFTAPPLWLLRLVASPFFLMNPPVVVGLENVPSGSDGSKVLFIGNQNLLGLDQLVLITLLYWKRALFCRRLHDGLIGKLPFLSFVLGVFGGVVGTRRNCEELMQEGQPVVFYPGGVAETLKTSDTPPYALLWGERLGWCHMAIRYNYRVVPFASVGIEDALWILFSIPLQPLLALMGEQRPPIEMPILAGYNSLEKQYFLFGAPIDTKKYGGEYENMNYSRELFRQVHDSVSGLVAEGRAMAEKDPERYVSGRLWVTASKWASHFWGAIRGDTRAAAETKEG